jgi:hypothetical protein
MKRQRLRNVLVKPVGAKSAPSVIIVPEPRPLPKPITMPAASNPWNPSVNGIIAMPTDISVKLGMIANFRPNRSIRKPAGPNRSMSITADVVMTRPTSNALSPSTSTP